MSATHTLLSLLTYLRRQCRFEKSIGVRELMHFFEVTHRSINALPSAPKAATSTKPLQLTAIPLISQAEVSWPAASLLPLLSHSNT